MASSEAPLVLLDELAYAAESDSVMLSALQHARDTHFQHSQAVIVLCGSHVRSMETLLAHQSPFRHQRVVERIGRDQALVLRGR